MYISRELLLAMLPEGRCVLDLNGIDEGGERFAWLVQAMYFPPGTKITVVSSALRFDRKQIALRLDHPDFIETAEAGQLPEVQALYSWTDTGKTTFACWAGPAVKTSLVDSAFVGPWKPPVPSPFLGGTQASWSEAAPAPENEPKRVRFREFT